MKTLKENLTKEITAAENDAVNETDINSIQLLQELQPLLKEYFIGGFELDGGAIVLNFKNGQEFRLSVEEV